MGTFEYLDYVLWPESLMNGCPLGNQTTRKYKADISYKGDRERMNEGANRMEKCLRD